MAGRPLCLALLSLACWSELALGGGLGEVDVCWPGSPCAVAEAGGHALIQQRTDRTQKTKATEDLQNAEPTQDPIDQWNGFLDSVQPGLEKIAHNLIGEKEPVKKTSFQQAAAEFVAMTLFVIFGCGSAMGIAKEPGAAWVLQVALTFGLAITVLAYSIGHYSGGQINCAVTFGLILAKQLSIEQGLYNFIAQMLGSVTGSFILAAMYPPNKDLTGSFGSNSVSGGWKQYHALVGEFVCTFLLMFTVLETAINPMSEANRSLACVAIGFAVFLAHSVMIPIDGCSINPTRSFGPAVVSKIMYKDAETLSDMWVFWLGPLLGAAAAVAVSTYGLAA